MSLEYSNDREMDKLYKKKIMVAAQGMFGII